ncbi:hypothetical protein SAMN05216503_1757 [Polaribacter sp. KT25b]|uniref:hypothetical protein n=1 Tax=Polaribacter sp. KT25b TaxID=1855336 RepID=UPI00087B7F91|nr:hypothetical protein [Polaribacter sp. KT25b]SDS03249.1 hypothetical protein SAMN05216503_1757 [Polaribacter sp. KT25b]
MTTQDLIGNFSIIGSNQDADENTYKGTLSLTLDKNERVIAKWVINKTQHQFGSGFFKNNILVINFNYKGFENKTYKGVVVYKCINKNILEGFWSEELGNPTYLGSENCFRITDKNPLLN